MSAMFYYDDIFDSDDPDFDQTEQCENQYDVNDSPYHRSLSDDCLQTAMSCGVMHSHSTCFPQSWLNRSESVESFEKLQSMLPSDHMGYLGDECDHLTTLEDLKCQFNSCYTCGVSWTDNHVSLDCKECGSYSLSRPCLGCDGKCQEMWQRNISKSHDTRKAEWEGECTLNSPERSTFLAEDLLIQGVQDLSTSS